MTSLQVPSFTTTGVHKKDYYLLNGSPDFAVIPGGVLKGVDGPMPIRLPYGDVSFGAVHIMHRHGKWVTDNEATSCVATLVWKKLNQRGSMFIEEQSKLNLSLKISPSALLILKKLDGFYSVTTLYHHQRPAKGQMIGTYQGLHWAKKHDPAAVLLEAQGREVLVCNGGTIAAMASDRDAEGLKNTGPESEKAQDSAPELSLASDPSTGMVLR